jgi:5-(carboxyamino)imidazole ribonucleotide mutase
MAPQIGIIMGSYSDLAIMEASATVLKELQIEFELTIVSAHRTPSRMVEYASSARDRGLKVIIAGAGGAAHLPGMIASITSIPVIGVPIKSSNSIDGWDSILSILQMPNGIPVATVALNGAKNAGILAATILGAFEKNIGEKIIAYKNNLEAEVLTRVEKLKQDGWGNTFDKSS